MKHTIKLSIAASLLLINTMNAEEVLEPITVTSVSKTEQSIQDTTSSITVITAEELEEKGYQTVAQAINTVAGISVTHAGGLGQQTSFFVRGADSGKVLVLLDGMRLNDPSTTNGTALLDSLATNNIQQIEIIKGGASSIWGSNASAGVINIITKEAKDGIHGALAVSYGSYKTRGMDADLSYKDKKLTAQILASCLKTDGFSALAPRDAEEDGYTNKNLNLKLGYLFDEHNRLTLSYNRIKTDTEYDDSFSADQADDDYSQSTSDQSNTALDYSFRQDNYNALLHASRGEYDRDYYTYYFGDNHNVYKATIEEYSLINGFRYTDGKAVLGLEYKEIDGFNQYNTYPESQAEYTNKAVFLSNTYHINDNTLFETNLRYDHYNEFDDKTTYKIGLKHDHSLLKGFVTSANYYTAYDAPSSYQLANPAPGALLKPSYTKGYDISLSYRKLISVSYFDTEVEDGIDYTGVWPNAGYSNIDGKQKFSGVELQSAYTIPSFNLHLSANYTHLFRYEKEDGTDLIRRAKDTLNVSVDYYTDNNSHIGIEAHYVGDREEFGESTGNYALWNLNVSTKVLDNIGLSLHAKNIFDKEYQPVYGYTAEGRSVYAKATYRF